MNSLSALLSASPAFDAFPFATSGTSSFALVSSLQSEEDSELVFAYGGGFNIAGAADLCSSTPSHSWEYGAASMALLELHTPWHSVYGMKSGWNSAVDVNTNPAVTRALEWIHVNEAGGVNSLNDGEGSTGDPASLGIIAWMIGKTDGYQSYATATANTVNYLLSEAPRYSNGAISHRADVAELWADFMYMTPPLLAFYGAETQDPSILYEGYNQCKLYREILQASGSGPWAHIIGPQSNDPGMWSTGNGWAVTGMSRVLATIQSSDVANWDGQDSAWWGNAQSDLLAWITQILDAVMESDLDNGLVRNYLDTDDSVSAEHKFGEISGSTAIASVIYRHAASLGDNYVKWADGIRDVLNGASGANGESIVTPDGAASPAIDPLAWGGGSVDVSPEGQAFVVMMYSAWRDCVLGAICSRSGGLVKGSSNARRDIQHGRRGMFKRRRRS